MWKKNSAFLVLTTFFLLGLLQGIGFTTIPAAGNFITASEGFSLNPDQYGALFLPMFVGAILASFLGGAIAKKIGIKTVFVIGQIFNILSMLLFATANLFIQNPYLCFPLFLTLMLFLGMGFGAALTSLNAFAFFFFPIRSKTALTALHSCLGIGTAIGPMAFVYFHKHGAWWHDGIWIAALYFLLLLAVLISFPNPHQLVKEKKTKSKLPLTSFAFWGFVGIALLYGICETTFGNWGTIFLYAGKHLSLMSADFALSIFWGVLTLGRILTVLLSFVAPTRYIYCSLPPIMLLSLFFLYPATGQLPLFASFALAGLGCSAMLPLTIGFAQERFTAIAPLISGVMIGVYMFGFGLASQGVGLIYKFFHMAYATLFASLSGPIIILFVLCLIVTHHKKRKAGAHRSI